MRSKFLVAFLLLSLSLASFAVSVEAGGQVDGYIWEEMSREHKTGFLVGVTSGVSYMGEFLGEDIPIFSLKEARMVSYVIDDWYEEQFPLFYPVIDVMMEGEGLDGF